MWDYGFMCVSIQYNNLHNWTNQTSLQAPGDLRYKLRTIGCENIDSARSFNFLILVMPNVLPFLLAILWLPFPLHQFSPIVL